MDSNLLGLFQAYLEGEPGAAGQLADLYREVGKESFAVTVQTIGEELMDRSTRVRNAEQNTTRLLRFAVKEFWCFYSLAEVLGRPCPTPKDKTPQENDRLLAVIIREALLEGEDAGYIEDILREDEV